ncbi:hypothetical protein ACROYT_G024141 [Oculina patagonica]
MFSTQKSFGSARKRSLDTVTKFKNVASDKTEKGNGKCPAYGGWDIGIMDDDLNVHGARKTDGCGVFFWFLLACVQDRLDDFGFPPVVLCVRIVMGKKKKRPWGRDRTGILEVDLRRPSMEKEILLIHQYSSGEFFQSTQSWCSCELQRCFEKREVKHQQMWQCSLWRLFFTGFQSNTILRRRQNLY